MLAEHELIRLTARHLAESTDPIAAGAFARALFDIFDSHQLRENEIILPLLINSDSVSLSDAINGAHRGGHHGHEQDRGH